MWFAITTKEIHKATNLKNQYQCHLTSLSNLDTHQHEKSNTLTVHLFFDVVLRQSLLQYLKSEMGYFQKVLQLPRVR